MIHIKKVTLLTSVAILTIFHLLFCDVSRASAPNFSPSATSLPSQPTLTPTVIPTLTPTTAPATPTPVSTSTPQFHTVKPGETLLQIASQYNLDIYDLAHTNHLTDINYIYAGQELLLASLPVTAPEATILEGKQIIVILSTQRAYAFENGLLQKEFIVSTGLIYPTVTGNYRIYLKYESTTMTGPGYSIPSVPWTMYFHLGYGLHGAPWNNNLGTPSSHGCVNMSVEDAKWLYDWAPLETLVTIIP